MELSQRLITMAVKAEKKEVIAKAVTENKAYPNGCEGERELEHPNVFSQETTRNASKSAHCFYPSFYLSLLKNLYFSPIAPICVRACVCVCVCVRFCCMR